jgi:hypothetical protein
MTQFEVINAGLEGRGYAVGDASEMDDSANQYVENLIDDIGYAGFSSSFARSYIDEDAVVSYAEDVYYEDVQNNPDVYFDDSERELSGKQEEKIEILKMRKSQTQQIISELEDTKDGENEENDEIVDEKIEELEDLIVEYEDEIQEIEDSPEGDFPQDMVDEKVEDLVADVKNDPESFMNEFGLEWEDYIDKDAFIEGVIESDGYGIVNSYDGNYDEEYVNDILFYVMRID